MKTRIKSIATGGILSFVSAFMIAIYAPLELYIFNNDDLWFDIYDMFQPILALFVAGFLLNFVIICISRVINIKLYRGICFLETVVLLYTYIQGNYISLKLPTLDGTVIDWSAYNSQTILSVILFIVLTAIFMAVVHFLKFPFFMKVSKIAGICLFVIMSGTLAVNIYSNNYTFFRDKIKQNVTVKDEMLYSTRQNMVILLLDRMESEDVDSFMAEEPEKYADGFEDFTYYRDAMGGYSWTRFSLPLILTGNQYKNDEDYYDFYTRSVIESPLFKNLEERDYIMAVYDVNYFICNDPSIFDRFTNILETRLQFTSRKAFLKLILRVVGYRYAPFGVKQFFNADRVDFKTVELGYYAYDYDLFTWFNDELHNLLHSQPIELDEQKHFKFIHLEGGHRPYDLTANLERLDSEHEYPDEDSDTEIGKIGYKEKERSGLTVARELINKLKEAGIYDNTAIVIMSDHGDYYHETYKAQNPLLLVKGIDEHHPLKVDMAPVSYVTDLQGGFENLMDGKKSDEIFSVGEGDKRRRTYLYYKDTDEHNVLYEYEQTGLANDMDTLIPTGVKYVKPENQWKPEKITNAKMLKEKKVLKVTISGEEVN